MPSDSDQHMSPCSGGHSGSPLSGGSTPWERPGCQTRVSIWLQLCDLGQVTHALLCDPEMMVVTVITKRVAGLKARDPHQALLLV